MELEKLGHESVPIWDAGSFTRYTQHQHLHYFLHAPLEQTPSTYFPSCSFKTSNSSVSNTFPAGFLSVPWDSALAFPSAQNLARPASLLPFKAHPSEFLWEASLLPLLPRTGPSFTSLLACITIWSVTYPVHVWNHCSAHTASSPTGPQPVGVPEHPGSAAPPAPGTAPGTPQTCSLHEPLLQKLMTEATSIL